MSDASPYDRDGLTAASPHGGRRAQAWFTLRLLGPELPAAERALCRFVIIPLSLALSVAGFCASAADLALNLGVGAAR